MYKYNFLLPVNLILEVIFKKVFLAVKCTTLYVRVLENCFHTTMQILYTEKTTTKLRTFYTYLIRSSMHSTVLTTVHASSTCSVSIMNKTFWSRAKVCRLFFCSFLCFARPQSQFPHSCVCDLFILYVYSNDQSIYSCRRIDISIVGIYKSLTDT